MNEDHNQYQRDEENVSYMYTPPEQGALHISEPQPHRAGAGDWRREMTKLEAWKTWSASAGAPGTEFALEKSSHGKAFSYAWDAALIQQGMPKKILGPNLEQVLNAAGFYKRKPLTGEEIDQIAIKCLASPVFDPGWNRNLARAIEMAHGIGGSDE